MDEMQWKIQSQPAIAEQPGLQTMVVWHGDDENPSRHQQGRGHRDLLTRIGHVLERMPEDDRGPGAADVAQIARAHIRPVRVRLQTERLATADCQRVEQSPVTGSDVEHRPRRGYAIKVARKATAGAAQDRITDAQKPT
jgi:hypothetical protein